MIAGRQLPERYHSDRADRGVLGAEPALQRQERRQHVRLELAAFAAGKRGLNAPILAGERDEIRQHLGQRLVPRGCVLLAAQKEPEKSVSRQRQHVGQIGNRWKRRAPGQFDRYQPAKTPELQLDRLRGVGEVRDAKIGRAIIFANIGKDLAVARVDEGHRPAAERLVLLSHKDHPSHPVQERGRVLCLALDVDRLVAIDRIHDRRQIELLRLAAREPGVAIGRPLHRRAHAIAVAKIEVVAHADLVAVVEDRRAGHRHQKRIQQLDLAPVVSSSSGARRRRIPRLIRARLSSA